MEDRRKARVGTVSGLALLTGATALVSVSGGHHSVFATLLLGLLAVIMAHALVTEIQRQARRRSAAGWGRHDTVNTLLLACWSLCAAAMVPFGSPVVQGLGALLTVGYAAASGYFVVERRRHLATPTPTVPAPAAPAEAAVTLPAVTDSAPTA